MRMQVVAADVDVSDRRTRAAKARPSASPRAAREEAGRHATRTLLLHVS